MQNITKEMDIEIQLQISSWHGNIHEQWQNTDLLGAIFVLSLESEYDEVEIQLVDYLHWAPG